MTNLSILCWLQNFLFLQFLLELYSHHNFSKASLDLQSFDLLSFSDNQPFDFTFFLIECSYYNSTLQHSPPNIPNFLHSIVFLFCLLPSSFRLQHDGGENGTLDRLILPKVVTVNFKSPKAWKDIYVT